ncbi:MAG: hypothetical protein Q4G02_01500 [bacterium]|nr:hypothetical protein [bacterium]
MTETNPNFANELATSGYDENGNRVKTESVVNDEKTRFNEFLQRDINLVEEKKKRIKTLEEEMESLDDYHREKCARRIADAKRSLRKAEARVEFMRLPPDNDGKYRIKVMTEFPKLVKELAPSELPLVFHGTNDIGTVRQIIKTGGLLTPEQKGESFTSFATAIDVTSKTNIRVSCEFAEPGDHSFMPYGAIFAFLPSPEEVDNVNATGESSEVFNGVDGVNFKNEPDRLYGIITTPENIERVKAWCEEYGWSKEKVFTHDEFLKMMEGQG